jgi:hypothetical protein
MLLQFLQTQGDVPFGPVQLSKINSQSNPIMANTSQHELNQRSYLSTDPDPQAKIAYI